MEKTTIYQFEDFLHESVFKSLSYLYLIHILLRRTSVYDVYIINFIVKIVLSE